MEVIVGLIVWCLVVWGLQDIIKRILKIRWKKERRRARMLKGKTPLVSFGSYGSYKFSHGGQHFIIHAKSIEEAWSKVRGLRVSERPIFYLGMSGPHWEFIPFAMGCANGNIKGGMEWN